MPMKSRPPWTPLLFSKTSHGVYIIVLFLLKLIDCGYLLEQPQILKCGGSSKEYPLSIYVLSKNKKKNKNNFLS